MFNDAALAIGAAAIEGTITHLQLHNGAPGTGWTANVVGARVAVTGALDGAGGMTLDGAWTGLTADQPVTHVSYWDALTGGNNYGGVANGSGDAGANAAGEFAFTATESSSST